MNESPQVAALGLDRTRRVAMILVVVSGLTLVGIALWRVATTPTSQTVTPEIMGTTTHLTAVGRRADLGPALDAAQAALRSVNRTMSTYDPSSELSRINAGQSPDDIAPELGAVLEFGLHMSSRTDGAFDATVYPLVQLWAKAAAAGRPPDDAELADARSHVGWRKVSLTMDPLNPQPATQPGGRRWVLRMPVGTQITLDAIAKGDAVDLAVAAMRTGRHLAGGMVEVGGDLRCFGRPADGGFWRVGVQSPWEEGRVLMRLRPLTDSGELCVCTSGNYRRYYEIAGKRYSHIIDPATGEPADAVPSVTVIAPSCMKADGWATALSVLGVEKGLKLVEQESGVEAMFVTGTKDNPEYHYSSGFKKYVIEE
ncbi:MAG: FAD:protein FMN transferase [Phycisphaerae bacterium]|nr:FAD:protein FMN transferase [Phycisphaerae bacterium]